MFVSVPPRDVWVQVLSASVRLGGNALLLCSCKADPPVSEYQWWSVESGNTQILTKRTHTVRIYNISRDTRVQCSAANRLGRASSLPTSLNVLCESIKHTSLLLTSVSLRNTGDTLVFVCICFYLRRTQNICKRTQTFHQKHCHIIFHPISYLFHHFFLVLSNDKSHPK